MRQREKKKRTYVQTDTQCYVRISLLGSLFTCLQLLHVNSHITMCASEYDCARVVKWKNAVVESITLAFNICVFVNQSCVCVWGGGWVSSLMCVIVLHTVFVQVKIVYMCGEGITRQVFTYFIYKSEHIGFTLKQEKPGGMPTNTSNSRTSFSHLLCGLGHPKSATTLTLI